MGFIANLLGGGANPTNAANAIAPNLQNYNPAISQALGQIGVGNQQQQQVYGNENALAAGLQQQVAGQGPGTALAQTQLQQATQQNIAQQASLAASMRGMNPALAQRQALQGAATTNQASANQSAQLVQQQQLAAQQQLAGLYGQQGTQALGQQQATTGLIGGLAGANNAQLNAQVGAQGVNQQAAAQNANLGTGFLGGASSVLRTVGLSAGGPVDGRAPKPGDDPQNDTVSAKLSPGEFVIPRTVMAKGDKEILQFIRENRKSEPKSRLPDGGNVGNDDASAPPTGPHGETLKPLGDPQPQGGVAGFLSGGEDPPMGWDLTPEQTKERDDRIAATTPHPEPDPFEEKKSALTQEQGAGINLASDIGQQGRETSSAIGKAVADMATIKKSYDSSVQRRDQMGDQINQGIASQKIDFNRLWNDASTGGKILSSIGMILGGGAQALTGHNPAVDAMNSMISRDVDTQKAQLGQKQTLFSNNLQMSHNEREAYLDTQHQLLSAAQMKLDQVVASHAGTQAKQQAIQANAQIEQKKQDINLQKLMFHMASVVNTQPLQQGMQAYMTPEQQKRVVQLPGGNIALATNEDTRKDAEKVIQSYGPTMSNLSTLDKLDPVKALIPGSDENREARSRIASLSLQLDEMRGLNRVTQVEYDRAKEQMGDKTDIRNFLGGGKASAALKDVVGKRYNSIMSNSIPAFKNPDAVPGVRKAGAR
jgi:hypothetical protein